MRMAREVEVDDARDRHQDGRADHREAARPPAGLAVPALAEDVIHRRTPKSTLACNATIRRNEAHAGGAGGSPGAFLGQIDQNRSA
jgi:hypothetical protein